MLDVKMITFYPLVDYFNTGTTYVGIIIDAFLFHYLLFWVEHHQITYVSENTHSCWYSMHVIEVAIHVGCKNDNNDHSW